jgi:hypothetical protein
MSFFFHRKHRLRRIARAAGAAALLVPLLVAGLPAAAQTGSGTPPRVGPDVRANAPQGTFPDDFPGRNDTTVASSADGERIVTVFEDFQGVCGPPNNRPCTPPDPPGLTGFAWSDDGGLTWTDAGAPFQVGDAIPFEHPWVDRGGVDNATFYVASRAKGLSDGAALGLFIHRGHFDASGFHLEDATIVDSANPNDFYSRQAVAAAKDGSGDVLMSLSNIIETCNQPFFGFGQIELWRTHDGGDSWLGPVVVSPDVTFVTDPNDPQCGFAGTLQIATVPAVGPNGEAYVVWQFGPDFLADGSNTLTAEIRFARSLDGGATFDAPVTLATINSMRQNPPVGYGKNRFNDHPRMAVATSGPHAGRVYVTYHQALEPVETPITEQSLLSSEIYITWSDDQGATWTTPTRLGSPVPHDGIKRFWPTVVTHDGGLVSVVYQESQERQATPDPTDEECRIRLGAGNMRVGTNSSLVDTYVIRSTNGGATFGPPLRLSSVTGNWCQAEYLFAGFLSSNFGDFIGASTAGQKLQATWTDAREGVPNVYFAHALMAGPEE